MCLSCANGRNQKVVWSKWRHRVFIDISEVKLMSRGRRLRCARVSGALKPRFDNRESSADRWRGSVGTVVKRISIKASLAEHQNSQNSKLTRHNVSANKFSHFAGDIRALLKSEEAHVYRRARHRRNIIVA
jgi:hypothetical protein